MEATLKPRHPLRAETINQLEGVLSDLMERIPTSLMNAKHLCNVAGDALDQLQMKKEESVVKLTELLMSDALVTRINNSPGWKELGLSPEEVRKIIEPGQRIAAQALINVRQNLPLDEARQKFRVEYQEFNNALDELLADKTIRQLATVLEQGMTTPRQNSLNSDGKLILETAADFKLRGEQLTIPILRSKVGLEY